MSGTTRCFNCSKEIPEGVSACPVCGFSLSGGRIEAIKEATELNSRAQLLESRGKREEAVQLYFQAVKLYPEFVVAHYNLGLALGKLSRPEEARRALDEAIRLKPDFAAAHTARGDIHAASGDYEAAVADYSTAIDLYPDYAQAYFKRALAWLELGDRVEACKDLEDYLFYKPHDARARKKLQGIQGDS
jgi:tetratricopeptide (TPR) repeat protein